MAGYNNKGAMLLLATIVLSSVCGLSTAKTVVVGGTTGWTIPPSPSFYSTWASQQSLQVGDVLVFNFPTKAHTVAEVTKSNYDSCTTTGTIGPIITTGPANITLTTPGSHYFICTIPTHCSVSNQKLTVTASSSAPAPAPKVSPTPSPKPSPSVPTPTSSPVPAPSTSSPAPAPSTSSPAPAPSTSSMPITPTPPGPDASMGPAGGIGSSPPPLPGNFAASTGVTMLSLLSFIVASALLF